MHFMNHYTGWCGQGLFFSGPLGLLFSLLFWGLVLLLVIKLFTFIWSKPSNSPSAGLEMLQKRYASGKIDEDTYLRMKKEFHSS